MTYEELLDKWLRKLGRDCTAGEIVHDLRQLEQPVRCKDCKHMEDDGFCFRFVFGKTVPDGYCAWGKRREEG